MNEVSLSLHIGTKQLLTSFAFLFDWSSLGLMPVTATSCPSLLQNMLPDLFFQLAAFLVLISLVPESRAA